MASVPQIPRTPPVDSRTGEVSREWLKYYQDLSVYYATLSNVVTSVNSQTGTVSLDADDISDTATTNKYVTASDITNLGNLSGTNTGDEVAATTSTAGVVKEATAIADLNQTITDPPTQTEVQDISDKIDALLAVMRTAGLLST